MNAIAVEHTIPIRQALHQAVAAEPDRAELRRDIDETSRIRTRRRRPAHPHLGSLHYPADELGIHLDVAHLPDELLPDDPNPPPFDDNDVF